MPDSTGTYPFESRSITRSRQIYENMKSPAFLKYYFKNMTISSIKNNEVYGNSPPDIFIGRFGYPNVSIGPLIPPRFGDTSILGSPELWTGRSMEEIVSFRSALVRGMHRSRVTNADNGRIEEMIKELALADTCSESSELLSRRPEPKIVLDENSQPYGPSAPLKDMKIYSSKANPKIEKAYEDTSMSATDALVELYGQGVMVSRIQKALAAGILGRGVRRRFVPTRWSITAVDDTLSKHNLKEVKQNEPTEEILVYENNALDNRWEIVMFPGSWEYELVEAWYPNTTWNMESRNIQIYSSYEPFSGRSKYAEIGGCYYAARLASSELLKKMGRQAKVVILREAHPGYIMPVGVWNVREHVREALRGTPLSFGNINDLFAHLRSKLDISVHDWMENSALLRNVTRQRRLA